MKKKIKSKTISKYRKLKITSYLLKAGTYMCPFIPATIITYVNFDSWFIENNNGLSIGFGFGSLLISILITIIGVMKRDDFLKENISALFSMTVILACWGISFLFLASIANQFGYMLLYSCLGLIGSATCDQINKTKISKDISFYKELISENDLDAKERKRKEKKEKARQEALNEAKRRATE